MKKSLKDAGVKLLGAALYGLFYAAVLRNLFVGDLALVFRLAALLPAIFLCLLALGDVLLTLLYRITGLDKKIEEAAAPPMGSVGGLATHFLGEFSGNVDTSLKGSHKDGFFRGRK